MQRKKMEGEINNFILVWSCALLSVYYCNAVSSIVPKGLLRFITLLPVICLFLLLPLHSLYSFHLGFPTVFCLSWVASFKLILLSFGSGPLSDPSLPLTHFIGLALLPIIKAQPNNTTTRRNGLKSPLYYVAKAMYMPSALFLYAYRDFINPTFLILYYTLCIYMGLELVLGICAIIAQSFLGLELDQPFDRPYLATSIADYWGKRWNLVSADILRLTIFRPIYRNCSKTLGRSWAYVLAIMGSFIVSGLMHELINYQIFRARPSWCYIYFFVMQGLLVVVESDMKKKLGWWWSPPRVVVSVGVLLMTICTFGWIVMVELIKQNVDSLVIKEYLSLCDFLMNFVGFQGKLLPLANRLLGTTW